jgi:hypothetical protein
MADSFDNQSEYDSQGELSQDYGEWLAEHLQDFADVIAWHLATHQGWEVADALAVKQALMEGAFDLSDLFTAANLNAKKVPDDFDPDDYVEGLDLDGSVPSISFTDGFAFLNDLLAPDEGYGPIDLSAFLEEAATTYWTNDTAKGENYHFRGMFTEFVSDQEGYQEGWENDDEPNYFTFDFNNPLTIVADADDYTDNRGDSDGIQGLDGDDPENTDAPNGTNGGNGKDAIEITNTEPYAGIWINSGGETANELYGGAGGAGGAGDSDSGTTENQFSGNTAAAGDGGDGGNGGNGGHAIFNGDLNNVIIEGNQHLTILGGDGGIGGAGGDGGDFLVTGNANNSNLSGGDGGDGGDGGASGDGTGGGGGDGGDPGTATVNGQQNNTDLSSGDEGTAGASYPDGNPIIGAFSHRVDVDASAFEGNLTISGSNYWEGETSGDDTMIFGSGITVVYATTGDDYYDVSNGDVTVTYTWHGQSDGDVDNDGWMDTIFGWGAGDKIDVSGMFFDDLLWQGDIVDEGGLLALSLGWYEEGGHTYVVADVDGDGSADFKIELLGGPSLSESDFAL